MKLRMFAVAAIAGIVAVGCNQESSVNTPALEQHSAITSSVEGTEGLQSLKIDETIIDERAGEKYSVTGLVYYYSERKDRDYSFFHHAVLTVTNHDYPERPSTIDEKRSTKGRLEEKVLTISEDYPLDGLMSSKNLRVHFRLSFLFGDEGATIASIEVISGGEPTLR